MQQIEDMNKNKKRSIPGALFEGKLRLVGNEGLEPPTSSV